MNLIGLINICLYSIHTQYLLRFFLNIYIFFNYIYIYTKEQHITLVLYKKKTYYFGPRVVDILILKQKISYRKKKRAKDVMIKLCDKKG
jgi:hypothetical protein